MTMTIQAGRTPNFGSPEPAGYHRQVWTPQPMRKNMKTGGSGGGGGESGSGGATLLQFWQRQERQSQTRMTSWASTPRLNTSSTSSSTAAVETSRGFVPSDVASDPRKKEFLTDLSKKIFSPAVKSKSLIQLNKRLMVRESNPGLIIIFLC